jgi:hypothetical protein
MNAARRDAMRRVAQTKQNSRCTTHNLPDARRHEATTLLATSFAAYVQD